MNQIKPNRCVCGGAARVRFKDPYVWVECKKKCGMKTGSFMVFVKEIAEQDAIKQWNKVVQQDGRAEYVHQD